MNRHKPFIVEFTGTPEAGKTTAIKNVYRQLTAMGYKVRIYPESAEIAPSFIPKGSKDFKLWIDADTFKHIIEAPYQENYDFIIFDRGSLDRIFWIYLDTIKNYELGLEFAPFGILAKNYPPDLLITLYVSDEESIRRRGGEGHIVTQEFVRSYNNLLKAFVNTVKVNHALIVTDNKTIEEVTATVVNSILENIHSY